MEQALKILNVFDLSQVSRREHAMVYIALMMIFVTGVNYIVLPKQKQALQMEATVKGLQTEINVLGKGVTTMRQGSTQTAAPSTTGPVDVPGGSRVSTLIEEITQTARVGGVDFVSVRPEGITDKGSYLEMKVRIDLKSRYRDVGEYLDRLQALPRAMSVSGVRIETGPEISPRVNAEIHLLTVLGKS